MQIAGRLVFLLLVPLCAGIPAYAQDGSGPYDIMRPEPTQPGVIPPYKSPRGTKQHVTPPRHHRPQAKHVPQMPPPLVSPRTGRVMPNIPPPGPGGAETFQDRAARCVHQSGVYAQSPGAEQNAYIGTCINQ